MQAVDVGGQIIAHKPGGETDVATPCTVESVIWLRVLTATYSELTLLIIKASQKERNNPWCRGARSRQQSTWPRFKQTGWSSLLQKLAPQPRGTQRLCSARRPPKYLFSRHLISLWQLIYFSPPASLHRPVSTKLIPTSLKPRYLGTAVASTISSRDSPNTTPPATFHLAHFRPWHRIFSSPRRRSSRLADGSSGGVQKNPFEKPSTGILPSLEFTNSFPAADGTLCDPTSKTARVAHASKSRAQ